MNTATAKAKCHQADMLLKQAQQKTLPRERRPLILAACELYQQVLTQAEEDLADPYIGLAYLIFSTGDKPQALELLETAMEISPYDLRAQKVYQQLKQAEPTLAEPESKPPAIGSIKSLRRGPAPNPPAADTPSRLADKMDAVSFKMPDFSD